MWEKEERGERLKETEGRQKKTERVKEVTLGKFHRGGVGGEQGGFKCCRKTPVKEFI